VNSSADRYFASAASSNQDWVSVASPSASSSLLTKAALYAAAPKPPRSLLLRLASCDGFGRLMRNVHRQRDLARIRISFVLLRERFDRRSSLETISRFCFYQSPITSHFSQFRSRHRQPREDPLHNRLARNRLRFRFVANDNAMTQNVGTDALDVLRCDVAASI
jgi:hypothetical protein